ncbi:hypothetical protein GVN16_10485 [Emticicia sp. CRIBPO]|uniref:hypothetical protein n=1 Tax=Emticicia sp. CRIBPO TaxID=2683258 RepID=UPI0014128A61|nr:hypothetical protein [Emticicia sp. CRIBPO]NBA86190.1 hypothetical protein [Emticicia sp. CRIBPO]
MMSVDELMSMVRQKEIKDFGNQSSGFVTQGDQIRAQQDTEQNATSNESAKSFDATVECGGPGQPPCPFENGIDPVDKQFLVANLFETFGLISGIKAIGSGVTKLNLYLSGKILAYRASKAAARTGTTAIRKVGSVLESVDDILTNPSLLQGQSYGYVRNMLGKSEGWVNSVMTKTRGSDKGWVLRQVNNRGEETGRLIQYHPGSRRHFGGAPYWKVSDGANTFRFPAAN